MERKAYLNAVRRDGTFIYGAGGHASVVEDFFSPGTLLACVTDDWASEAMAPWKDIVYSPDEIPPGSRVIVAIGDNKARETVVNRLRNSGKGLIFPMSAHPSALISGRSGHSEGSMYCANSVVIAGVMMGDFVIINTGATVDHDCYVEDFAHIAPGVHLCGNVRVGARTLVGVGTSVIPGITIGADSVIGAGSVVVDDIPSNVVAVGNPCRVIKELK